MKMTQFLVAVVALGLAVPMCMAADVDIENAVVGSGLSGRKLMRNLMGDDGGYWGKDSGKDWKKPPPEPKYQKKTCYATSTYQKDDTYSTSEKTKKYYKTKTFEKVKTIPVTTYTYSTYDKVVKKPYYKTYYYTSTTTYAPTYKTYPVEYYKKKGWGEDYHIPAECQTSEPSEPDYPKKQPSW